MPEITRALRHRNYRLYFFGQLVSLAGTWMQQIAMSWLTYRMTGSVLMLGLVGFAGQIPILLFAPVGGIWSDRVDRRVLLMRTQSLAMIQAIVLAVLTLSGAIAPWHLVAMALVLGCINAVDAPARQSLAVHLVDDRADLPNAIALNSFTMNSARLLGPSIGGFVVAAAGEGVCFVVNAVSYLTVIFALGAMRVRHEPGERHKTVEALKQGFDYAFRFEAMRALLLLVATVSFFATPYAVLMPYYAREVFGGGAQIFGLLMASSGSGALLGTIFLASRKSVAGMERGIARAVVVCGVALATFALAGRLWLAVPALVVIGFCLIVTIASSNTLIQTLVRDELRGRVMAIFTMAFLGVAPLGSLAAGGLAHAIGADATLLVGAAVTAAAGLIFSRKSACIGAAARAPR